ncbi:MAG: UDP-glucose--hexose-1-phosphate uridylyltransferase [Eubacterium sp.]|nr:UDP-glucose--hexose-1-phosphate uridylyltransferase [Eubacterium sp.]
MSDLYQPVKDLINYALQTRLITEDEVVYSRNRILQLFNEPGWEEPKDTIFNHLDSPREALDDGFILEQILKQLLDIAAERGLVGDNTVTERDLFDSKIMDCVMPRPGEIATAFRTFYRADAREATDWFYEFSQNTDYIRRYRVSKDLNWATPSEYGDIEISVNLSKPEKDPKAIAAARESASHAYPKCQLCIDNVGYGGRLDHPGRSNHRAISIDLCGEPWYFQYSPYVYYNEHCIVLSEEHRPMHVDATTFDRLLDFVSKFPHYFVGSNADLPIVGGSILSHDHFQGGRHTFPMEKAPIEVVFGIPGYEGVKVAVLHWPLSVIRLQSYHIPALVSLADHILEVWRSYTDEEAGIFCETDGVPHNTITPIARKAGDVYELDLALRCNVTSDEHPLGVFHPHEDKWHIKKENIGLIEVMGLAILPGRLASDMQKLSECLVKGVDVSTVPELEAHADWTREILAKYDHIGADNVNQIICDEVGNVFTSVLEDCGVFKCTDEGRMQMQRFLEKL